MHTNAAQKMFISNTKGNTKPDEINGEKNLEL